MVHDKIAKAEGKIADAIKILQSVARDDQIVASTGRQNIIGSSIRQLVSIVKELEKAK